MSTVIKSCEFCGHEFEDKSPNANAKYCSQSHKLAALRKRKKQNGLGETPALIPASSTGSTSVTKASDQVKAMPLTLDPISQFLINRLENEIRDYKDKISKLEEKLESASAQEKEYEKQIADLTNEVSAKPTGLSGFMQNNPSILEKAVEALGPRFGEGLGKLIEKWSGPSSPYAEAVVNWMVQLSPELQNEFYKMMQGIVALGPEKTPEKIAEITRSLMSATETQQPARKINRVWQ
ncbi:hypothetical protein WSM22_02960 [Cytophagales bacterium WSM2-2]|nr:hypothetical protein WSM22_02960 [Cytophagales bacterium WSM2-2]